MISSQSISSILRFNIFLSGVCALKLRNQKSIAGTLKIFIHTNPHRTQDKQYFRSIAIQFATPTNSTSEIIKYAMKGLDIIFKQGYNYMKCGVELLNLVPEDQVQLNIFSKPGNANNKKAIAALDKINRSLGKEIVRLGIQGFSKSYKARAAHLSPCYTTRLDHIIKIKN